MLTGLWPRRLMVMAVFAVIVGLGVAAVFRRPAVAFDDAAQDKAEESQLPEPFDIPDGTAKELFAFVKEMASEDKEFDSEDEQREHILRRMATQVAVGDKILNMDDLEDDQAKQAAQMKLQGLVNLAHLGVAGGSERAVAAVEKMTEDERPGVAEFAKNSQLVVRIIVVGGMEPKQREELITEILNAFSDPKELQNRRFAQVALRNANLLGRALSETGDQQLVLDYYDKLVKLLQESEVEELAEQTQRLEGQLRQLKLPGNFLEVEGVTLAGEDFDWKSYRGKVVLVDFWATWCGPCRQELPNVLENYEKYHDKGFEVVGISLDEDQADLEEFIKDEQIPWVTLFPAEESKRGWENPMAVKYGISGIPKAILVDKEGKVVSLSARGEELSQLLAEMLDGNDSPSKK